MSSPQITRMLGLPFDFALAMAVLRRDRASVLRARRGARPKIMKRGTSTSTGYVRPAAASQMRAGTASPFRQQADPFLVRLQSRKPVPAPFAHQDEQAIQQVLH